MPRVAIIGNEAFSLVNFRGPLIAEMVSRGAQVFALAPNFNAAERASLEALGARPVAISLARNKIQPLRDVRDVARLAFLLRQLRIEIAFSFFLKPVIVGTIAAWLGGVERRYTLVAGLGYAFTDTGSAGGPGRRLLQRMILLAIGLAFRLSDRAFFQNEDDRRFFVERGTVNADKTRLVAGTGVDLDYFTFRPLPKGTQRILFVGRLLREKGVRELVAAARILRQEGVKCIIAIAGGVDTNPGALSGEELEELSREGLCEWLGHIDDVRVELARSHVFVLPSYREGKPRSTQEALAMGLPVITTDAVGCRDTVVHGVNGWIVPVGDAAGLARAIADSLTDRARLAAMGKASRKLAEDRFDVRRINGAMLAEMGI